MLLLALLLIVIGAVLVGMAPRTPALVGWLLVLIGALLLIFALVDFRDVNHALVAPVGVIAALRRRRARRGAGGIADETSYMGAPLLTSRGRSPRL